MDKQLEKVNEIGDAKNVQRSNVFSFQKPINLNYKTLKIKKQQGEEFFLKNFGVSSELQVARKRKASYKRLSELAI
ncbi:MAG: hypothetical protein IJQ39_12150 [Thermoguttaceae bacterium]|nr:hypothetical protein [Thermoguttaceae bacterium]